MHTSKHTFGLLLFVLTYSHASAQCSKDTDCKFDRICEKSACIAPQTVQKKIPPISKKTRVEWSPELAIAIGKSLQDQLGCKEKPEPGKVLRALRTNGVIEKPSASVDGMNIFPTKREISVFGQRVLEVTGWESSPDKSLFWRGPGTAPPHHIVAVVEGDLDSVKRKVANVSGSGPSVSKTTLSTSSKPAIEIACYYDDRRHGRG